MRKSSTANRFETKEFLAKICWGTGLFMLPFNQWILLWQEPSQQGLFNPYTSVGIYVSELFFLVAGALNLLSAQGKPEWPPRIKRVVWLLTGLLGLSVLLSKDPVGSALGSIHVVTMILVMHALSTERLSFFWMRRVLLLSLGLQAVIGILQVGFQHSLGLSFWGESIFSPETAGVAKMAWNGITLVRAHGTLPHANLLAGYLLMGLFLLLRGRDSKRVPLEEQIAGGLIATAFLLTGSQGALLGAIIGMMVMRWRSATLVLIGGIIMAPKLLELESIRERWELIKISFNMFVQSPWGVGWHQFTARMQEVSSLKLQTWQFQPVHNIYLLLINELGLLGIFLLREMAVGFKKLQGDAWKQALALSFAVIGLWDHYFLSLYQGMMLFAIVLGLLLHRNRPQADTRPSTRKYAVKIRDVRGQNSR